MCFCCVCVCVCSSCLWGAGLACASERCSGKGEQRSWSWSDGSGACQTSARTWSTHTIVNLPIALRWNSLSINTHRLNLGKTRCFLREKKKAGALTGFCLDVWHKVHFFGWKLKKGRKIKCLKQILHSLALYWSDGGTFFHKLFPQFIFWWWGEKHVRLKSPTGVQLGKDQGIAKGIVHDSFIIVILVKSFRLPFRPTGNGLRYGPCTKFWTVKT